MNKSEYGFVVTEIEDWDLATDELNSIPADNLQRMKEITNESIDAESYNSELLFRTLIFTSPDPVFIHYELRYQEGYSTLLEAIQDYIDSTKGPFTTGLNINKPEDNQPIEKETQMKYTIKSEVIELQVATLEYVIQKQIEEIQTYLTKLSKEVSTSTAKLNTVAFDSLDKLRDRLAKTKGLLFADSIHMSQEEYDEFKTPILITNSYGLDIIATNATEDVVPF